MNRLTYFYDTCALLELQGEVFESEERFYISQITLKELENIKTSNWKDEDIKWQARRLLHLLEKNRDKFTVFVYQQSDEEMIKDLNLPVNDDSRIIICALKQKKFEEITFVTADLSCKCIAESLGLNSIYTEGPIEDDYTGYLVVNMANDEELANFYSNTLLANINKYNLLPNQYLLIKYNGNITDKYKWMGDRYEQISFCKAQSKMFGKIVPKDNDPYQQIALDSLATNKITMLRGPAGSGKSYLAFGQMFSMLEDGLIDKIVIFCNTVATKGSAKLGFYPGSRTEKLLDSQIGNLLESKIGDRIAVERLIDDGNLVLLPMSDIRGYDTTGMHAAVYISEAQNLDIELMRLALQRIGNDSICIIDGDDRTQLDMSMYAGSHNGMKRVSKVFRGAPFFGEVTLQNIHRSEIAELAQKL